MPASASASVATRTIRLSTVSLSSRPNGVCAQPTMQPVITASFAEISSFSLTNVKLASTNKPTWACTQSLGFAFSPNRGRQRKRHRQQYARNRATFPRPVEPNRTAPVQLLPISTLRNLALGAAILTSFLAFARTAAADATLIVDADSGKVLHAEHATYPWYPASTSKLMTMYLVLRAVKDKRLTMETPLTVSPNAVAQAPSKMGFKTGTIVTVDNALKMLMVKSANDMAALRA